MAKQENSNGSGGGADIIHSALDRNEFVVPAAVGVVGALAAAKGPAVLRGVTNAVQGKAQWAADGARGKVVESAKSSIGDALGSAGPAGKAVGKLTGLSNGGGGGGGKKTRRLPIQRWTDVAVPVDQAYEAWTNFEQYPKFMHRVLSVEQKGKDKVSFQEKIWFSKRQWEGRITERRENDRIVWKTTNGMSHKGIVSFHELTPNLTRVMVEMEFEPSGIIEKLGSGLRFVKRAVQSDLARFKAFVEMQDAKGIEYRSAGKDEKKQDGEEEKDEKDEDGGGQTRKSRGGQKRTPSARRGSTQQRRSSSGSRASAGSRKG